MIDLEKLEADIRRWVSVCMDCTIYIAGILTGLAIAWVFW